MSKREAPHITSQYVYRRRLEPLEVLPAVGIGLGVGALAFYIAYLFIQRTPLDTNAIPARAPAKRFPRGAVD